MKTVNLLFVAIILLEACASPKKTTTKDVSPAVTRGDLLRGGTSFSNAVVIKNFCYEIRQYLPAFEVLYCHPSLCII